MRCATVSKLRAFCFLCGTVPRVQQSRGKVRHRKTREDVNRYLKRAYAEAPNTIIWHMEKNLSRLEASFTFSFWQKKGHQKAVAAAS
ncbi:hypothetical protein [Candidatus Hadarchaeum sp.]|uniref:hypothetical protein n=1 Tax=Candidatus Hadarchaeum sp. TaxID=2883567 RepID=UPI00319DD4D9